MDSLAWVYCSVAGTILDYGFTQEMGVGGSKAVGFASIQGPLPAGASCVWWRSQFPPSPNRCWWWWLTPSWGLLVWGSCCSVTTGSSHPLAENQHVLRRSRTRRTLEPSLFCLHRWMLLNILIDPWLQEVVSWTYPNKLYKTVSMMALYNEHPGSSHVDPLRCR